MHYLLKVVLLHFFKHKISEFWPVCHCLQVVKFINLQVKFRTQRNHVFFQSAVPNSAFKTRYITNHDFCISLHPYCKYIVIYSHKIHIISNELNKMLLFVSCFSDCKINPTPFLEILSDVSYHGQIICLHN